MRIKLTWLILLIPLVAFVGCSYTAKVEVPTDDGDAVAWRAYYDDQFKANGNKVPVPDQSASTTQRIAYEEAKDSFETKSQVGLILGIVALLIGLGSLLATLSQV